MKIQKNNIRMALMSTILEISIFQLKQHNFYIMNFNTIFTLVQILDFL